MRLDTLQALIEEKGLKASPRRLRAVQAELAMHWHDLWSQLLVEDLLQQNWLRAGWERAQIAASRTDIDASAEAPCAPPCVTTSDCAQDTMPVFQALQEIDHSRIERCQGWKITKVLGADL